jgi:hypothetical protein
MWLARCYVRNGKSRSAWELYLKLESSQESFAMLQLLANDCYKVGAFLYAAKAFDTLERLDPNPEYWDGKRGACVGVFQVRANAAGAQRSARRRARLGPEPASVSLDLVWRRQPRANPRPRAALNRRSLPRSYPPSRPSPPTPVRPPAPACRPPSRARPLR